MTDRDRADRIRDLFGELADLSAAERAAHLTAACGEDAALRRELESLLGAADAPDFAVPALESIRRFSSGGERPGSDLTALEHLLGDRYRVEREIGRGGMATVYLATDRKHHRSVAIKVLDPELSMTLGPRRFLREIEIAASLRHPNILPLFDSGDAGGLLYYVMPHIESGSLRQRLDREPQLPLEDAVGIAREIADALTCAHDRGVTHRDVKPGNILLDNEHAVLADFGIASALAGADRTTLTGGLAGTPAYMSPERLAGDQAPGPRSDQYALACVLYEMLAGARPVRGVDQHRVTDVRPEVPAGVATAVARGLAPDPADRFPSTAEFAKALTHGPGRRSVSRRTRAATWLAAAGAAVALTSLLLVRTGVNDVDTGRVAIVPFVNRTGSSSLDFFGPVLAEVVSVGLGSRGGVDVVPSASVGAALALSGADRGAFDPQAVRDLTGAGLIIQGSYFMVNDSLGIQAQIVEATERASLAPIALVVVPVTDHRRGMQLVLERVQVVLAGRNNPILAQAGRSLDLPVSMEAFTFYETGLEKWRSGDYTAALESMHRAAELDPTSASPLIWAAAIEWNATGNIPVADSLLRAAEHRRAELLPLDAAQLDWLRAFLDGDYRAAGEAAQHRAELGGRVWSGATVQIAIYSNQLDRAFRGISRLLEIPALRNKPTIRQFQAILLHVRGDHTRELREVRNAMAANGDRVAMLRSELRALAALGRTQELRSSLEYLAELPFNDLDAGIFRETAAELRAHGWSDAADEIGRLAVAHYERIVAESNSWFARFELAATLAELGGVERDRARSLFEDLDREGLPLPFSWPQALGRDAAISGYLGIIAAAEDDTAGAEGYIAALDRLDRPYLRGAREYWQARIAATLGQCARAVRFLEAATRNGQPYQTEFSISIAELPEFMTLHERGCSAYERFIQPG